VLTKVSQSYKNHKGFIVAFAKKDILDGTISITENFLGSADVLSGTILKACVAADEELDEFFEMRAVTKPLRKEIKVQKASAKLVEQLILNNGCTRDQALEKVKDIMEANAAN